MPCLWYSPKLKTYTKKNMRNNNIRQIIRIGKVFLSLTIFFIILLCNIPSAIAQSNSNIEVSGTVTDINGEPLPGVNVIIENSARGTITDMDGNYKIKVDDDKSILQFSLVGFQERKISVNGKRKINVTMNEESQLIDEVVVVGYGTQKKVTLTGAVSSLNSKELLVTPSSNVQNMLAGKIPGVRIQQRTGEPGSYDVKMDIRGLGSPLIVIDGIVREVSDFQRLEANEIESVSVLKDASAAIYGMRASNGVILVTTKRGEDDKTRIDYTGSIGFQNPSGLPDVLNTGQFAELVREADKNMGRGINSTYTLEDLERFRAEGGTDWYDLAMKSFVPQTHHNVTASGRNKRTQYFLSFGYYGEDGVWKTGDLNYKRYNIRSNLGFDITDNLKAEMLISLLTDEQNRPYKDTWEQFKAIWALKPTELPYANNNTNFPNDVLYGLNPLMITDADKSGYKQYKNRTLNTTFSLTYNIPYVKGLSAKLLYGFDYKNSLSKEFQKEYTLYKYDSKLDVYNPQSYNGPSSIKRRIWEATQNQLQFSINYDKQFNDSHNLKVLALYEQSSKAEDNFWAKREFEMDAVDELFAGSEEDQIGTSDASNIYRITNMGFVGRVNYDYRSKYIAEASFRYDGSSKFAKNHRWGFFPSVSVGYRISEESFIKDFEPLSFISNFKIRASYGVMGDDGSSSYQYLAGYDYPGASYVFGDEVYKGLGFRALPNELLTWYTSKTLNVGGDWDFWNGLLFGQIDFFWRYRDGLLGKRSGEVPGTIGAELPEENLNEDLYKGFEIVIGHRNRIDKFNYSVSLNFALTRRMNRYIQEGDAVNSYDRWRNKYSNRYTDMGWAYGSAGQFTSMEDIWNSPIQDGQGGATQLPGDWKYEDWNEDGIIDDNDVYPNTYEHTNDNGNPKMTFGATIAGDWNGLDFNLLFQGGAGFNVIYFEQLQYPLCFSGNGLATFYDRYRQDDNGNWIPGKWPTTRDAGSYSINYARCKQTTYDASYLRLKSVEIGYTLPGSFTQKFKVERLRFFANGYNLFTLSNLDFVDPEHPEGSYGYLYPIMRNFNFGVNITF